MTDIENLKKMNKLIPELKKHGFAATSDEAAEQSAQLYQSKYIEETKEEISRQAEQPESAKNAVSFDHLDRLKSVVNGRLNNMDAQLSTVTAKMNEMIKMINKLETLQGSTAVKDSPEQRQTVIKTDEKTEKKEPRSPRSGNYKSSDVEIDKIFYFGNK